MREAAAFPVTERRGVRAKWVRLALAGAVALLIVATLVRYGANQPGADEPPPVPELAATLVVNGLPSGTKVELDGRVASGPRLQLAAGRHALRLTAPGFVPMDTVLDIVAGTRLSFAFNGTPAEPPAGPPTTLTGTLHVRRLPSNGTITVDGKPMSGTSLALAAGEHRVRMEAPGYTSFEHTVTVAAGKSQALTFGGRPIDVEPSPGQTPQPPPLPSTSTPGVLLLRVRPFAKVFVDDRLATEDAMLVRSLSAGQHRLRFEKDGYVTLDSTIEILAGDTLKIAFVLEPRAR